MLPEKFAYLKAWWTYFSNINNFVPVPKYSSLPNCFKIATFATFLTPKVKFYIFLYFNLYCNMLKIILIFKAYESRNNMIIHYKMITIFHSIFDDFMPKWYEKRVSSFDWTIQMLNIYLMYVKSVQYSRDNSTIGNDWMNWVGILYVCGRIYIDIFMYQMLRF